MQFGSITEAIAAAERVYPRAIAVVVDAQGRHREEVLDDPEQLPGFLKEAGFRTDFDKVQISAAE